MFYVVFVHLRSSSALIPPGKPEQSTPIQCWGQTYCFPNFLFFHTVYVEITIVIYRVLHISNNLGIWMPRKLLEMCLSPLPLDSLLDSRPLTALFFPLKSWPPIFRTGRRLWCSPKLAHFLSFWFTT